MREYPKLAETIILCGSHCIALMNALEQTRGRFPKRKKEDKTI
jgi:hypothetical protein